MRIWEYHNSLYSHTSKRPKRVGNLRIWRISLRYSSYSHISNPLRPLGNMRICGISQPYYPYSHIPHIPYILIFLIFSYSSYSHILIFLIFSYSSYSSYSHIPHIPHIPHISHIPHIPHISHIPHDPISTQNHPEGTNSQKTKSSNGYFLKHSKVPHRFIGLSFVMFWLLVLVIQSCILTAMTHSMNYKTN